MLFSIAGPKTIHEYNNLKQSKQEVNINKTSKHMDEYVYDKNSGLRNASIITGIVLSDILIADMLKNDKILKESPKYLKVIIGAVAVFLNLFAGNAIYNSEKEKQAVLNNNQEKLKIYQKRGLNAVI